MREVTLPALERGCGEGRQDARRRSRSPGRCSSSPATTEEEIEPAAHRHEAADRVLRLDARVPRRARAARLGRSADRAQPAVEAGRVGGDGRAHHRRRSSTTFAVVGRARGHPEADARPLRRRRSTASRSTRRTSRDPERWTRILATLKAA